MNPKLIKKQFEKSLDTYNKNAIVQKIMAEKLVSELCNIKAEYQNILELGSGAGLLTKEIAQKIKFRQYFANDIIEKSEQYIRKIIPTCHFYCGDARRIKPVQKMDLIISNAMFQWFDNLEKVSKTYSNMLNKDGILAFTSFSSENYKEIKELTGLSLNYKTIKETEQAFSKDFEILYKQEIMEKLEFSNSLELLAHMKNTGVNSLSSKHWTFKNVKDFCENYKDKYPECSLTYDGMLLICKKL